MSGMGRKADNNDAVLLCKVAKPVGTMAIMAIENKKTVATRLVLDSSSRVKIMLKPYCT
jgi:hypothetical protein